ncbi:phosphatidylglycerophosphatase A [Arcobacter sp. FWKO B]|uniref:phosphatidylglycerophosphatase A family protein n=1 Tax=Arcobacter sp. FWKO B TaxID=2593672 RepID=UPI0018A45830|nr:phosphatidylglycerophosphatase A [Arcobacter sp. FWKO B]QOG12377.1 phosphatidylglycerophosphatase A [Arcobacter sp. FWKO B]
MRKAFLTLFYSGLSPKAPGTVGSVVALILGLIILWLSSPTTLFLLTILVSIIAVNQIDKYEHEVGSHDDKEIVIDELAGMWLCLSMVAHSSDVNIFIGAILGFALFRFFDIAKPSIIGKIDAKVKGGLGVMGDDIVAGFFAGLVTLLILKLSLFLV